LRLGVKEKGSGTEPTVCRNDDAAPSISKIYMRGEGLWKKDKDKHKHKHKHKDKDKDKDKDNTNHTCRR
jgi:hypothetical protein